MHRDVKPANLLLDDHDRLGIGDFGIARLAWEEQVTQTGQVLGTAAYLAPEQAMGEPATAASDRYALSVVAFELLTGEKPFNAEHFAAQARAHVEDDPPRASELNPDLTDRVDAVIDRGMAKDPDDRWESAAEFVGAPRRVAGRAAAAPHRQGRARRADALHPPAGATATARRRRPRRRGAPRPPRTGPGRSGPGAGVLIAGLVGAGGRRARVRAAERRRRRRQGQPDRARRRRRRRRRRPPTPTPTAEKTSTPTPTADRHARRRRATATAKPTPDRPPARSRPATTRPSSSCRPTTSTRPASPTRRCPSPRRRSGSAARATPR